MAGYGISVANPPPNPVVLVEYAGPTTGALTTAYSGSTYEVDISGGDVSITLPACSTEGVGTTYTFVISGTALVQNFDCDTVGNDIFIGGILVAGPLEFADGSTENRIRLSGSVVGSWVKVTMVSSSQWLVNGLADVASIEAQ